MVDVVSPFVSALFSTVVDRTARPELVDFFRGNNLDEELLQNLKMLLLSVARVLSDAEEKQFIDPWVKEWVDRLKDAAYDADDVLDEIVYRLCVRFQPGYASSLNPFKERVQSKVRRIVERLKSIVEHKDLLALKEGGVGKSLSLASATTSLVDERRVYGRNGDKEKIIDFLLSSNFNGEGVPVVAIVGMGGVGKTTLAQILYNHARVRNHFELVSWTSVSEALSVHEMTRIVLESFTMCHSNISDLNGLQINLKHILTRRRFLLVLDGFLSEDFIDWDIFQRPFLSGKCGSRIIVTARSQNVATTIRADLTHSLSFLTPEDTWKLFSSHAFKSGNPDEHPVLAHIGHKIVRKCGGLPLAAITLGSVLRSKEDDGEWQKICDSRIWEISSNENNIFSALKLSYTNLPSHLKQCFAYCSVFPKGHPIDKRTLIHLWMAEGILPRSTHGKRMEDLGEECFQELLSRSLFHQPTHHKPYYLMHELVNDLAQYVAGEFCHKLDDDNPKEIMMSRVRHVSYLQGIYDDQIENMLQFCECKQLRTFLPFKFSPVDRSFSISSFVSDVLLKLKRLRVLSLSGYAITKLPDSVGHLIHMRYLDLAYTSIVCLPDSICTLYNLETLLLSNCSHLTMLPGNMSNLVNLRHLDISRTSVTKMPTNLGNLKSLQVLTSFVVGGDEGSKVSELKELSELHGSLSIVNLQNVVAVEASNASLNSKKYLHKLEFWWTTTTHNEEDETNVLDMLEPHQNVKKLKIHNFGGFKLPNWLGSSISTMVFLHLVGCETCLSLPSLGQLPCLRELYITKMTRLQKVGPEFYGNVVQPFRSLKIMKFEDMPNWEEWSTSEQNGSVRFTMLQELHIGKCSSLVSIPCDDLPKTLRSLEIDECRKLELFHSQNLMQESHCFHALERLSLNCCCDSLISFPLSLFPMLEDLSIQDCSNLQSISSASNSLPCLRKVTLTECSNLARFPEGGLPAPKLESLTISRCADLSPKTAWGLEAMTSLTSLYISGLPCLTSLEHTGIQYLTSLKILKIMDCVNLGSLPLGPLVTSLSHLTIIACPLLKVLCERDTGEYWSMVSLIPFSVIED